MMRDGRNPYGSRGGYVRDSRGRDYEGRMSINGRREGGRKSGGENPFEVRGTWTKGGYMADYASRDMRDYRRDRADYRRDYADRYDGRMDRNYRDIEDDYADYNDYANYNDYRRDYRDYRDYRNDYGEEKLDDRELMDFSKRLLEEVDEKDKQMFKLEVYLRLAKDWLCDEDTAVQYGEKLAVYYDAVVEGM